jgi:biotin carboxylase
MVSSEVEKWFWLVGGGPMQIPILRKLRADGYKIILSDGNPDCPGKSFADLFYTTDIHDVEKQLALIPQIPFQTKAGLRGVTCIATDAHQTVARLATELSLPGISSELSKLIGDKVQLRRILTGINVYQPKFLSFERTDDLDDITSEINEIFTDNFKLIVKPLGWSASRGIKTLDDLSKIKIEIEKALKVSRTGGIVVEEAVNPDGKLASETSIETLVIKGKVSFLNMVDRVFGADLIHFDDKRLPKKLSLGVEFGHINPSSRSRDEINRVVNDLQKLMKHLKEIGVYQDETFILKADILFSTKGPVIIEATPRCSGGWDSSFSSPMRGLRIQDLAIEMALGHEITAEDWIIESRDYVAVVSDANEKSIDCLGRTFYGGVNSNDPGSALSSALDSREENRML